EDSYRGIQIHRLPLRSAIRSADPAFLLGVRRRALDIAREFAPGIVHAHGIGFGNLFQLAIAEATGTPLVATIHLDLSVLPVREGSLARRLLESAAWITTVSPSLHAQLFALMPATAERSCTIVNGVSIPDVSPAPLVLDPPTLLCLGRLVP